MAYPAGLYNLWKLASPATTINWANPITKGLILTLLPGKQRDLVFGEKLIGLRGTRGLAPGVGTNNISGTIYQELTVPVNSSSPTARYDLQVFTIFCVAMQTTETNTGYTFIRGNGSSLNQWGIGLYGGTSDGIIAHVGSFSVTASGSDNTLVGKPHAICLKTDGTNANTYLDGNSISNTSSYTQPTYAYNQTHRSIQFGNGNTGLANNTSCFVAMQWNRTLSDDEIISISRNPVQLFKPNDGFLFAGNASELVLILASLGQAQSLGNISLTQQNTISISSLGQTQTLENIALTQANTLALDALSCLQNLENIVLTQANILSISDLSCLQSIANIVLTQQNVLTSANLGQSQTLANLDLSSGLIIAIDNAFQSQNLETLSLIQQNILALNTLSQLQSLGNIDLIQQNILSSNSLSQSNSLNNLDLSIFFSLSINPLSQAELLSSLSLTEAQTLSLQDLYEIESLDNLNLIQDNILIINDLLHAQLLQNLNLLNGQAKIFKNIIYIVRDSTCVMILNSASAANTNN